MGRRIKYEYEGEFLKKVTYANDGIVTYNYTKDGLIESIKGPAKPCIFEKTPMMNINA